MVNINEGKEESPAWQDSKPGEGFETMEGETVGESRLSDEFVGAFGGRCEEIGGEVEWGRDKVKCNLGPDKGISVSGGSHGADVFVSVEEGDYERYEEMEFFEEHGDKLRIYKGYRSAEDEFVEF